MISSLEKTFVDKLTISGRWEQDLLLVKRDPGAARLLIGCNSASFTAGLDEYLAVVSDDKSKALLSMLTTKPEKGHWLTLTKPTDPLQASCVYGMGTSYGYCFHMDLPLGVPDREPMYLDLYLWPEEVEKLARYLLKALAAPVAPAEKPRFGL